MTIRAEITGSDRCMAEGHTVRAAAPVLALCRELIAAGHHPATPLQAWRGKTLCLVVRSIGEAARLEVNAKGTGFVPLCAVSTAPPMRPFAEDARWGGFLKRPCTGISSGLST